MNKNGHPPDAILSVKGVTKSYGSGNAKVEVLNGIDLEVPRGEIAMIMGPSGVGKSTLLNLLATLDEPTSGEVFINGENPFSYPEKQLSRFRNQHIGIIYQFHYLFPELSALENVMMPSMIRDKNWKNEVERGKMLLAEVGLSHRLEHLPKELSGGEQQRVAIARAFINNPALVLADEPTGDLDRTNSAALFDLIQGLNEKFGQTFVIVTHDETFARKAHRLITLTEGRVSGDEVLNPTNP
ncbi:MAG TPA: ABC transporter ATP-binding protein [Calditrichia bacterium]|nr:ABC transporter ATP-binding protein [Calditrichia bacterium]HQV32111.1 ABC transporter ATP-binding protein [Calditrichia bacterium]